MCSGPSIVHALLSRVSFALARLSCMIILQRNLHVHDFLLVINSNLGPISHRFWDTATYWPKITNFDHPLSFRAFVWGDTLRIYGKALRFLKLKSSWQPTVKIWWFYLGPFCLIHPCDRQTDGQTELRWLRRAESIAAFARKKLVQINN